MGSGTTSGQREEVANSMSEIVAIPLIHKTLEQHKLDIRREIEGYEKALKRDPRAFVGDNAHCPLDHHFVGDFYIRTIQIPAGTELTGKIHRHAHANVLASGRVRVVTEHGGFEILEGPYAAVSRPGTKRALCAETDLVWITVHNVGKERDLKEIEKIVIAESYEQLEREALMQESGGGLLAG